MNRPADCFHCGDTLPEAGVLLAMFVLYTAELIFLRGRGKQSPPADLGEEETHRPYPWLRVILGS